MPEAASFAGDLPAPVGRIAARLGGAIFWKLNIENAMTTLKALLIAVFALASVQAAVADETCKANEVYSDDAEACVAKDQSA